MTSLVTLIPLSLSLSTDAFAASVARGTRARQRDLGHALKAGATFGTAEGVMCLVGWLLGAYFAPVIEAVDHWIALVLLVVIGGRMIREGLANGDDDVPRRPLTFVGTVITAIGTSIDSAAVGIALAVSGASAFAALLIGTTSFVIATIGFLIGPAVGARFGHRAEIVGGLVLVAIGIMIFADHTWLATS